jgi:predicted nucleotide-binding protein
MTYVESQCRQPGGAVHARPRTSQQSCADARSVRRALLDGIIQRFQHDSAVGATTPGGTTLTDAMKDHLVFIGHGRSLLWRELKDFLQDRLKLPCVEFNSESPAGIATKERLSEMLDRATIAFLLLTGEAGLFQGRLGFTKAIILLEDGCVEFSNIHGLGQIRFPKGNIQPAFEEIRRVLEREKVVNHP